MRKAGLEANQPHRREKNAAIGAKGHEGVVLTLLEAFKSMQPSELGGRHGRFIFRKEGN